MIKKIIATILVMSLTLSSTLLVYGEGHNYIKYKNFKYEKTSYKEMTAYYYVGKNAKGQIAEKVKGIKVRRVYLKKAKNLKELEISRYVSDIDLAGNKKLKKVKVNKNNKYLSVKNNMVLNKKQTKLLSALGGYTEFEIPDSVTYIERYAFNRSNTKKIVVSKNIKELDQCAFNGATKLTDIYLQGNNVPKIGEDLLSPKIKQINIHVNNESVVENLLKEINGKTEATICVYVDNRLITTKEPYSVYTSGNFKYKLSAYGATICGYTGNESTINIPESLDGNKVEMISSLDGARENIKTIVVPKYVSVIDENLKVEKYHISPDNKEFSSVDGVVFNKDKTRLLIYPKEKKDINYTEPSTVTTSFGANQNGYVKSWKISDNKKNNVIESKAFYNCAGLEEIVIPKNIKIIGPWSFAKCKKLKNIKWHDNIQSIDENAFENDVLLSKIKLPVNTLRIGKNAFSNCGLISVTLNKRLNNIAENAFANNNLRKVKVPDSVERISTKIFNKKTKVVKSEYLEKDKTGKNYCAKIHIVKNNKKYKYNSCDVTRISGKRKLTVRKGKSKKIITKATINNNVKGMVKNQILNYISSDKNVIKVSKNGKIKALKKGSAVVTVTLRTAPESYIIKDFTYENIIIAGKKAVKKSYKIKITVK